MSGAARAPLVALILTACDVEDWRNADLQLDIEGASLGSVPDEVVGRICIDDVGRTEDALQTGRLAFPGLPAGQPLTVTVDTLDDATDETRTGRAGPVILGADAPYLVSAWEPCEGDACAACTAEGALAQAGEDDWLLAVRFVE